MNPSMYRMDFSKRTNGIINLDCDNFPAKKNIAIIRPFIIKKSSEITSNYVNLHSVVSEHDYSTRTRETSNIVNTQSVESEHDYSRRSRETSNNVNTHTVESEHDYSRPRSQPQQQLQDVPAQIIIINEGASTSRETPSIVNTLLNIPPANLEEVMQDHSYAMV